MQSFIDSLEPPSCQLQSPSPDHLEQCAMLLAPILRGGDFVGLIGELGAGKTTWCRGLGRGLNSKTPLRSPSYLLMHEVEADLPILHLDAYFEHRLDSLLSEGECERFDGNTLVLVEWANHASEWWPKNGVYVVLSHNLEGGRCLAVHPLGERGVEIADAYAKSLKFAGFYEPAAP